MPPVSDASTADDGSSPLAAGGGRRWSSRQSEILDELEAVFLAEGFRNLTIADLVDRLHCSRRTLYTLAPSREELVLIVIDRVLGKVATEAASKAAVTPDPADAITAFLGAGVLSLSRARRSFTEDVESYMPTKYLYDRHVHSALGALSRLVAEGVEQGMFRAYHPPLVAEILDAAVERIRRPEALARAGVSTSQALAELGELMRYGLVQAGSA